MWLCSAHSNKIRNSSHFDLWAAPLWVASLWHCCNVCGWQRFLPWVQTVSGAPPTAFWGSVYLWDLINYAVSAAGNTVSLQNKPLPALHCPDLYKTIGSCLGLYVTDSSRRQATMKGPKYKQTVCTECDTFTSWLLLSWCIVLMEAVPC